MQLKNKLDDCLREGIKGGERHKGLRKIDIDEKLVEEHIKKAKHNLNAITEFKNVGYSDWSASAAFYALYHCLLALLVRFGYQSRNQTCTFAFVEDLINRGKISLKLEELKEIFDRDITENLAHSEKILDIRENMQYSFKTSMEVQEFNRLLERTKFLFDKIMVNIESL
ncbi:MAG: HEPN domain-containing protein [Nanoarchaeota archaeon]